MEVVDIYNDGHIIRKSIKSCKDTNSCTVVALACVTGNTFQQCDIYLRKYGRQFRRGMTTKQIRESFKGFTKFVVKESPYSRSNRITVGQFLKKHPVGKFYCCNRNHAFAIIDGVLYDHTVGLRRQITLSYRFYTLEEIDEMRRKV